MSVAIDVQYQGHLHCLAKHGPSKKVLETDAPVDNGGKGEAFSPTDLLATALGTCALTVMGLVAQRHGLDLTGAQAKVVKEMTATPVRRIGQLTAQIVMPAGRNFSPEDRARLEHAATICPVKQSLHPDVALRIEFIYPV
jgi:putative redox protein